MIVMKKVMLSLVLALSLVVTPVSFNPSTAHASKKIDALKGKSYKKKCKRMYHDKLFFGKKKLKGKYIRLNVTCRKVDIFKVIMMFRHILKNTK